MADTDYDGIFGTGFSFTFTPTSGTAFGTAQAQVEEATPPPATIETAKYTPISGDNSGIEQVALGRFPVQEYKFKVTYSAAEHAAAMTCLAAKVKGTLVCTYGDGSTDSFAGAALTSVQAGANTAAGLRTADITVTVPVPATFSTGAAFTVVNTTAVLSDGAVTIDLTASPYSATDKYPSRMYLLNPVSNANSITIAVGAATGYTGFGAAFSTTLVPGQSVALGSTTDVTALLKHLDVTGTGAQVLVVQVHLQ